MTSWNPGAERLYGYAAEEMVGRPIGVIIPPERAGDEQRILRQILQDEYVAHYETERVRKDGTRVEVSLAVSPIRSASGDLIGLSVVAREITELRRAARRLAESESRFAAIFQESPLGIALVGDDFKFLRANRAFCEMLGYAEDELRILGFPDITHPDDLGENVELTEKLFAGAIPSYRMEKRYLTKDGRVVWGDLTATLIRGLDGGTQYGVGMIANVTERKITEERLRDTEERFRRAMLSFASVQNPNDLLQAIADAARELVDCEYAALAVHGPAGHRFQSFAHSGVDAATVERIGRLPEGKGILGAVLVEGRALRLADLREHPASAGVPPHHPPMHSFLGVPLAGTHGIVGDIFLTNKRGAQGFSAHDEALILALAPQAAIAIENARRFERERDLVSRMRRLTDVGLALGDELRSEAIVQKFADLAREVTGAQYAYMGMLDEEQRSLSVFAHSGMDEGTVRLMQPPVLCGLARAIAISGRPVRLADLREHPAAVGFPEHHPQMAPLLGMPLALKGRVIGVLLVTNPPGAPEFTPEDETVATALASQAAVAIENARTYEREREWVQGLRDLNQAKTDFVSTVSHELRTPVGAIAGLASLLASRRRDLSEEEGDEFVRRIALQAERLANLVEDLLDLSRLEAGQENPQLQAVRLSEAAAQALEAAPPPAERLVERAVPDHLVARADPRRLQQILVNLLTNAYRHGGRRIRIEGMATAEGPVLSVVDDGEGVAEALVPHLFQKFTPGAPAAGRKGMGLGLAIARAVVETLGGRIWHEPGQPTGARFNVLLRGAAETGGEVSPAARTTGRIAG